MGIWDRIKGQFIEIIEWLDPTQDTMVYRFPVYAKEIKMGAKLTVRESQAAVFVNEGRIADVYRPGMYTLSTQNMPILSTLMGWKYGFESPFKAEVYFVNTKNFTDLKWGTPNPINLRDPEFGIVPVRAFGSYCIKVGDPAEFVKQVTGTDGLFQVEEINGQLRTMVISRFTEIIHENKIPAMDLYGNYTEVSKAVETRLADEFKQFGLVLTKFVIENTSLPPAVQEAVEKRAQMGILSMGGVGDLGKYQQFSAAQAMQDAAKNPSGVAGAGVGLGAGISIGQAMAGSFQPPPAQPQAPAAPPPQAAAPAAPAAQPSAGATLSPDQVKERLVKLKEMSDMGLLTPQEYEKKRQDLLAQL